MNPIGFRFHAHVSVVEGSAVSSDLYVQGEDVPPRSLQNMKLPILRYAVYARRKVSPSGVQDKNSNPLYGKLVELFSNVVSKAEPSLGITATEYNTAATDEGELSNAPLWSAFRATPAAAGGIPPPPPLVSISRVAYAAPLDIPKHHLTDSNGEEDDVGEGSQNVPIHWSFINLHPQKEVNSNNKAASSGSDVSVKTMSFPSRDALLHQLRRWAACNMYLPNGGGGNYAAPVPSWVSFTLRELESSTPKEGERDASTSSTYELVFVPFIQRHPTIDRSCYLFPKENPTSSSSSPAPVSEDQPSLTPHNSTVAFIPVATTTSSSTGSPNILLFPVVISNRLRDTIPTPSSSSSSVAPFPMAMPLKGLVDEISYLVSLSPKYGS